MSTRMHSGSSEVHHDSHSLKVEKIAVPETIQLSAMQLNRKLYNHKERVLVFAPNSKSEHSMDLGMHYCTSR